MNTSKRGVVIATAFAAAVAAVVTGATMSSGQTKETSLDQSCAHATWPMIPAQCVQGAEGRTVRVVTTRGPVETDTMAARFALAFN
jgi:hypothetical protein